MVATFNDRAVEELRGSLRGQLITPADPDYDEARKVWNALIDRRPALVVRCRGAADVIACVNFARDNRLPLAVRGGGHSVGGMSTCDDGLVIDFSQMRSVRVDPATRTVRAEPGVRLGELDRETQAFGLATTAGTVSDTGIAGLTLGGGFGWLMGRFGMTVDNLISVDVVTAGGKLLKASAEENEDLFWAVRGGGGNFGVVTSFEYRLHPVGPMIVGGLVAHPIANGKEVLKFYRDFVAGAPDELTALVGIMTMPDGQQVAAIACGYSGPLEEAENAVEPLRRFGPPAVDMIGPMPYLALQSMMDEAMAPGALNYWKADFLRNLDDAAIDRILDYATRVPSPQTTILVVPIHGAARRVPEDATAFPHRTSNCQLGIYSYWQDPAQSEANIAWTRDFWNAMRPHASGQVYVNELDFDEGEDRVRVAYGRNYERLARIKAKYDPDNLFRLNANIRPAAS